MKWRWMRPLAAVIAWTAIGCADGTARLDPIDPFVLEPMPLAAKLIVSRESLVRQLEAAGTLIYVGEAFAQYADAYIDRGFSSGRGCTITARLTRVHAQDFRVEIDAEIRVDLEGREVLRASYRGESSGNAWDGMYSDRSLFWKQAADEALRSVFKGFLADARSQYVSW